jgi:hypothetical protein
MPALFKAVQPVAKAQHIEGIDYLRSIMSIFVVIWHMNGVGHSLIFSRLNYAKHAFGFSDFLNFHILLLAVPVFIFISIYLFSIKQASFVMLRKRVSRLCLLTTFWPVMLIFYNYGYHKLASLPWTPWSNAFYTILQAGQTIYYFFPSLIICLIAAFIYLRLNRVLQIILMLVSLTVLAVLPAFTKLSNIYVLSAYWNPFNFIPLTFAAILVAQNNLFILKRRIFVITLSLLLSLFFAIIEWRYATGSIFFIGQQHAIPAYTRASLLFEVIALFTFAMDPMIKTSSIIRFLSMNSLALYCLHPFLISPISQAISFFIINKTVAIYVSIVLVIIGCYLLAIPLRKWYLREQLIT